MNETVGAKLHMHTLHASLHSHTIQMEAKFGETIVITDCLLSFEFGENGQKTKLNDSMSEQRDKCTAHEKLRKQPNREANFNYRVPCANVWYCCKLG